MIYIIIWAVLSVGDMSYIVPTYYHTIVCDEKNLAVAIQEIKSKGWQIDIKIYKATPVEYEYWETPIKIEEEIKEPHFKFKDKDAR